MKKLEEINKKLNITTSSKKLIFIYTPSKVGSTSLVTSLRINLLPEYSIFHLHDEELLEKALNIKFGKITIMDIIEYNQSLGKTIYVFDIYREPIEHKISLYFETLYDLHFNNTEENMRKYSLQLIIQRFNKIFPFLKMDDYFQTKFHISFPNSFDFSKKYLLMEKNNIKFVKLRLKDSSSWNFILSTLFKKPIFTIKDYESKNKKIKNLYLSFYENYKLPINFLHLIESVPSFQYYLSPQEQSEYITKWSRKTSSLFFPYTTKEYSLYYTISLENKYYFNFQKYHYIDEGCICRKCCFQRGKVLYLIKNKQYRLEKIFH